MSKNMAEMGKFVASLYYLSKEAKKEGMMHTSKVLDIALVNLFGADDRNGQFSASNMETCEDHITKIRDLINGFDIINDPAIREEIEHSVMQYNGNSEFIDIRRVNY